MTNCNESILEEGNSITEQLNRADSCRLYNGLSSWTGGDSLFATTSTSYPVSFQLLIQWVLGVGFFSRVSYLLRAPSLRMFGALIRGKIYP